MQLHSTQHALPCRGQARVTSLLVKPCCVHHAAHLQRHATWSSYAAGGVSDEHSLRSRMHVIPKAAPTSQPAATRPVLPPLDDDFERIHTFGDFANYIVPGTVLVGQYPYCDHTRCSTYEQGEARLEKIIEGGVTTFVSVQGELPPQDHLPLSGKDGLMPYKATAELIKSAHSPPPSMEVMMNLRNPTLDKFLPPKKHAAQAPQDAPSYTLHFRHFPLMGITDVSEQDWPAFKSFVVDLAQRIKKGEKLYVHCTGGTDRSGATVACLLVEAFGICPEEAVTRVERAYKTRESQTAGRESPKDKHLAFVQAFVKAA